jgi:exopolyphosphatase/guanosine-5'-triphosphate,3'-diphosphate pyrophosphatase
MNGRRPGKDRPKALGVCLAAVGPDRLPNARPGPRAGSPRRAVYAALDLGTNNCRLLVARPAGNEFQVIDRYSRVVCLGEGLADRGRLSEAAMARGLAALTGCAGRLRRHRATRLRAVATEACRRAANGETFLERVRDKTGLELEIISSGEEARLAHAGCAPLLDPRQRHALIFDIGGGSTELSWLELSAGGEADRRPAPALRDWHSLPIGVVNLSEAFGGREVSGQTYRRMVAEATAALAPFEARHGLADLAAQSGMQMLGTSGTATTLAGVHKRLPRYDRARVDGTDLRLGTVHALCRRLSRMSYPERVAEPCVGRARAELVVAGCAILEAICRTWPVARLRVADRGLREGILVTLMRGCAPCRPCAAGGGG